MSNTLALILLTETLAAAEPSQAAEQDPASTQVAGSVEEVAISDIADEPAPAEEALPTKAATDAEVAALERRLLGDAAVQPTPAPEAPGFPSLPPWAWLLGCAGLGGLYYWRQHLLKAKPAPADVEVLSKTRMGRNSQISVIRVRGEDGRTHRLLISTGEGGSSLVADLGNSGDSAAAAAAFLASEESYEPDLQRQGNGIDPSSELLGESEDEPDSIFDESFLASLEARPQVDDGRGVVRPPRVPVWNEPPEDAVEEAPPPAQLSNPLRQLAEERRTQRTPQSKPPAAGRERPAVQEPPGRPQPALSAHVEDEAPVSGRESFLTTLDSLRALAHPTGSPKPEADEEPPPAPSPRRKRRSIAQVKPLRAWDEAPSRRQIRSSAGGRKQPATDGPLPGLSEEELPELVADILRERDESGPVASQAGVVDFAAYLRDDET